METNSILDKTRDEITHYIEIQSALIKLEIAEKSAKTAGSLMSLCILLFFFFVFINLLVLLAGLGLSTYLGNWLYGFGLISIIYLLLFIILLLFRKQLIEIPITNKVIQLIFDKNE